MAEDGGGRRGRSRRRTELKKIEDKNAREVTFTKRRGGLFRKASELSVLCGAEVAIIAYSPHGNPFVYGAPSASKVLRRFLGSTSAVEDSKSGDAMSFSCGADPRLSEYMRREREMLSRLEEARTRKIEAECKGQPQRWWEDPMEDIAEEEELEHYIECVERLMEKATQKAEEMRNNTAPTSTAFSPASAPMASASSTVVDTLGTGVLDTSNGVEAVEEEEIGLGDEELGSLRAAS
ncbi:agamous-like MADS-box protein AGL61 [Punica granatum]|uniref:MADS-box domain-containing protein n=2 Tax=Punica granatum TaxID=22663 RepID=A0A218WGF5_PUNGR|nr:agamous-like MADS-box protein AGL61 [Punica granatum]OWM71311.1 hypothetical protein CDL15_Pgr011439 [Punica granatum]PKI37107.1 hypothetical protein CRG98_042506 [Punica granatum]